MDGPIVAPINEPTISDPIVAPINEPTVSDPIAAPISKLAFNDPIVTPISESAVDNPIVIPMSEAVLPFVSDNKLAYHYAVPYDPGAKSKPTLKIKLALLLPDTVITIDRTLTLPSGRDTKI